jgi:hypothetical protein
MVGYIQSQDRAKDRLKIGPDELMLTALLQSEIQQLPLVGSFSVIAGRRTLFYRWNGQLRLRFGADAPIDLNDKELRWECQNDQVRFTLCQTGKELINESYSLSPDIKSIAYDPTPFVEAEDFDFFLFVRNVLSDPARANRIYRNG